MLRILTHGGSTSRESQSAATAAAAERGLERMRSGASPLRAAVAAVEALEDDPSFNAGTGSNLRLDGKTVQMDAACMDGDGRFGAVAAIEGIRHPIRAALHVLATPHLLLAGDGATRFARRLALEPCDPVTAGARQRYEELLLRGAPVGEWEPDALRAAWNYEAPFDERLGAGTRPDGATAADTVGAVAFDGRGFAAALSSGGAGEALLGRVGDVPLPGCGLWVGPSGAIALTGDGEHIARILLARCAYEWLAAGASPRETVDRCLAALPEAVDLGVLALAENGFAGGARHGMAWSVASSSEVLSDERP